LAFNTIPVKVSHFSQNFELLDWKI